MDETATKIRNMVVGYSPIIIVGSVLLTMYGLLRLGTISPEHQEGYRQLYRQVEQIADTNHDGRLDNQELINFYNSVGMPFKSEAKSEIIPTQDQFNQDNLRDYIEQNESK